MAGFSKQELITWLRQEPRTRGWGAILAFNRSDTNSVMQQAYIKRFSTGHYLRPVEGFVGDNSEVWQYISDYVMDYPRLSFEIADVENEIPDARLTMQVVGGTHVTFAAIAGGLKATRIEVVDPLNGPELTLNVHLQSAPASLTSAGKVQIDLRNSSDFNLSYSDDQNQQRLGGEFFKQLFESTPENERVMVISEIKKSDSSLKPGHLRIRTQKAPGADVRSAENYGDGAVVVCVAMEGQAEGAPVGPDFKYLIPNDSDKDYSATIVLGNQCLLETLGHELLGRDYVGFGAWTTQQTASKFWEMNPAGGHLVNSSFIFRFGPDAKYSGSTGSPFTWDRQSGGAYMHFTIKNEAVDVRYVRNSTEWCNVVRCWDDRNGTHDAGLYALITAHVTRPYALNAVSQLIEPGNAVVDGVTFRSGVGQGFSNDAFAVQGYSATQPAYDSQKLDELSRSFSKLLTFLPPVNTFVLQSLLFKTNSIVLDDMALPGDMIVFGRVGSTPGSISISPQQAVIGKGETLQFSATTAGQFNPVWRVENIPGDTGDFGTITRQGLYTPPARIEGAFIRVRVTVTSGASISALVTVVASNISLSPLVQICNAGHRCTCSWAIKGSYALMSYLKKPDHGGKLTTGEHGTLIYTAPQPGTEKGYVVDEIVIKNLLTGRTRSAWVLAVLATMPLSVTHDRSASLPAGQIRLQVKSGTSVIPEDQVTWKTLAGSGDVVNGIYTQPDTLTLRFALLLASWAPSPQVPDLTVEGYILLPLPLFDYPEHPVPGLHYMTV